jgi:hypothetical protein
VSEFYTVVASANVAGRKLKKCGGCGGRNALSRRRCRDCGVQMVKRPKARKPARGSMERVALDLAHAAWMADQWASRAKAAVTKLHEWNRRERALAARLAAGPQPPRPKVAKPKPPRRAINLQGLDGPDRPAAAGELGRYD